MSGRIVVLLCFLVPHLGSTCSLCSSIYVFICTSSRLPFRAPSHIRVHPQIWILGHRRSWSLLLLLLDLLQILNLRPNPCRFLAARSACDGCDHCLLPLTPWTLLGVEWEMADLLAAATHPRRRAAIAKLDLAGLEFGEEENVTDEEQVGGREKMETLPWLDLQ
ncbi:hypothetical protein ACLOJK_015152 [Asimina triloba]